jgi:sulfur-carrier protein adenylyltransferase/sulfurtransferase
MHWKDFFNIDNNISSDEAREMIAKENISSCILLDVRQPDEYQREHIPGAVHAPLPQLASSSDVYKKEEKILVYCSNGLRSKAAAQLLQGLGFKHVFNIIGGIKAWNGQRVMGTEEQGMEFFFSKNLSDAVETAWLMEDGLQQLYLTLARQSKDEEHKKLLLHFADFENSHKSKLSAKFPTLSLPVTPEGEQVLEGGLNPENIIKTFGAHLYSMESIINLAMMLESQAYDFYSRLCRKYADQPLESLFCYLAEEEKKHLSILARELEKISR